MKSLLLVGLTMATVSAFATDITIPANTEVTVENSTAITYDGQTADAYSLATLGDGVTLKIKAIDSAKGLPQHFVVNGAVTFDFSECAATPWFSGSVVSNAATAAVNVILPTTQATPAIRLGTWRNITTGTQFGNQQKYYLTTGNCGIFWQYSTGIFRFATGVRPTLQISTAAGFWKNPEEWLLADGETTVFDTVAYSGTPCVHMLGPDFFGSAVRTVSITNHHVGSMHRKSVGTNVTVKVGKNCQFFFQTNEYAINNGNPFGSYTSTYDVHYANVDLNGGTIYDRSWNDRLEGKFTGTGYFNNTGWGAANAITTNSVFDAEIEYTGSQFGCYLAICTPVLGKPIKKASLATCNGAASPCNKISSPFTFNANASGGDRYCSSALYFRPPTVEDEPSLLPIVAWVGNAVTPTNGPSLKVFAKQTVTIGSFSASGANHGVHVYGPDKSEKGLGTVIVGTWASNLAKMYLATNVSFTVTNFNSAATILVDTYRSANHATFTFLNSDSNGKKAVFKAVSPKQLPCGIAGFEGKIEVGPQMVYCKGENGNALFEKSETAWTFPIDTAAATPEEANPNGCGGSGALDLKYASGTLAVDLTGDAMLKPGHYPLLTCTSGGEALSEANWPLTITRNGTPTTAQAEGIVVRRGAQGVELFVPRGLRIFIR